MVLECRNSYTILIEMYHNEIFWNLKKVWSQACEYIPHNIQKCADDGTKPEPSFFSLIVDLYEEQPPYGFVGHLIVGRTLLRFNKIILDDAFLLPCDYYDFFRDDVQRFGVDYKDILLAKAKKSHLLQINIWKHSGYGSLDVQLRSTPRIAREEVGNPYYNFGDIKFLRSMELPETLTWRKYQLVSNNSPIKITHKMYCVLFAELNNPLDKNAIKVLRWFAQSKERPKKLHWGDVFFEFGYISRNDNIDLHRFMVNENSRILFGIICQNEITLLGGVSFFYTSNLYYPQCLYNIPIV